MSDDEIWGRPTDQQAGWGNPQGEVLASPTPAGSWPGQDGAAPGSVLPAVPGSGRQAQRGRHGILVGVVVLVMSTVTAGAGLAYVALGGGGDQPERHVPGNAMMFAKIDLDPDVSQKVNAIRFLIRLPKVKDQVDEKTDLRQWAFEQLTKGSDTKVTWDQVGSWLGDRAGFALLPGASGGDPRPVLVVQVKDEKKAQASLAELPDDSGGVVKDGWATIAQDAATARSASAAAAAAPLSDSEEFSADLDAFGQDGIATLWLDSKRLGSAIKDFGGALGAGTAGLDQLSSSTAHGVMALRFDGPRLELAGRFAGVSSTKGLVTGESGISTLPADTLVAAGVSGVGKRVTEVWDQQLQAAADQAGGSPEELVAQAEGASGLQLPEDLVALLGDRLALAVGGPDPDGNPTFGIRGHGTDADQALNRLVDTLDQQGLPVEKRTADGGDWVLASTTAQAEALAAKGTLGQSKRFTAVVPLNDGVQPLVFADLAGIASAYGKERIGSEDVDLLNALGAAGVSTSFTDISVSFVVRVGQP